MKYIVVEDCILTISGVTPGTATITSNPSTSIKKIPENKFLYSGNMTLSISGCTNGTYTQNGTLSGIIVPTATKVKESNFFVLENDHVNVNIPMDNSVYPFDSTTFPAIVTITNAGQNKILGV